VLVYTPRLPLRKHKLLRFKRRAWIQSGGGSVCWGRGTSMYTLRSSRVVGANVRGSAASLWLPSHGSIAATTPGLVQLQQRRAITSLLPRIVSDTSTSHDVCGKSEQQRAMALNASGWRYLLFADLHVSVRTLDRCLHVLKRIRYEPKSSPST